MQTDKLGFRYQVIVLLLLTLDSVTYRKAISLQIFRNQEELNSIQGVFNCFKVLASQRAIFLVRMQLQYACQDLILMKLKM